MRRWQDGQTVASPQEVPGRGVRIRAGYAPGLVGGVGALLGRYYAKAWGAGAPYEVMAVRDVCAFIEGYDPDRDLMLAAYAGEVLVGSIAVIGRASGADGAHLRFFLVDPSWQGNGIGKALFTRAMAWWRERGGGRMSLWTVDGLPVSRRMYEKAGFRIVERVSDARNTVLRENIKMVLDLPADGH
ncbi:GNAT family N-acetyltransferase [Desulfovibrio sp. JY]|nr:GNAT family N-acetyltransferase [Desulfovibrio sp. JY]